MLQIETKEIKISDELKRKIEMLGRFINTKLILIKKQKKFCFKRKLILK